MKILVTGGYGFIGSHLVERLIKEKHDITIIDDLSTGNASNLNGNITLFKMGVEDTKCEKIFADYKFEVVVHLAFKVLPKENAKEYGEIYHANTVGLSNILYFSQKYHVNKLIVLSSYQVYGKQNKYPILETSIIRAENEKVGSYLEREHFCKKYRKKGLNVVVLRLGSVYGPRQPENFISRVIKQTLDGKAEKITIMNQIKDYIYISDVVEAIFKTCENQTSSILNVSSSTGLLHSEIQRIIEDNIESDNRIFFNYIDNHVKAKYLLDNEDASFQLEWTPKYTIEEGLKKTIEWSLENLEINKIKVVNEEQSLFNLIKTKKAKWFSGTMHKYAENLMFFIVLTILMIVLKLNFSIEVDLLIIYIVLVNVYYGWWQGIISIFLSTAAYVGLKIGFENATMAGVFSDVNQALYIAMYFIVGGTMGYVVDLMKVEKAEIQSDLDSIREELYFTNEMYDKSIEIKNSLQETIESNEDSLGKIFTIISQLDNVIVEQIPSEAAIVFSKMLKTESVHLYYLDSSENLRLASVKGNLKYRKSLRYNDYDFLESVIVGKNIYINKEFTNDYPMVCAPIFQDARTIAIVFLDNLEFKSLTYQFLNTLKVLTYLIANAISKATEYEKAIQNQKYFKNTFIMKKNWFELLIKEKQVALTESEEPIYLLVINRDMTKKNVKLYYKRLYNRVEKVFRESDYIGELDDTKLAILLLNTNKKEAVVIENRLKLLGITDTSIKPLWRIL